MNTFGFFLTPPQKIAQEYQKIIDDYAQKLDSVSFEPHITICGIFQGERDDVLARVEKAIRGVQPLSINFSEVSFSSTYHQCVFARAVPTAELMELHLKFNRELEIEVTKMYVPHLSLIYGDFEPKLREKLAQEIKLKTTKFMADQVVVIQAESAEPKSWIHVGEFKLGQN